MAHDAQLDLRLQLQLNTVADEVSAVTAVVRPILHAVLFATRQDIVDNTGGYQGISLEMLTRVRKAHDGECGICFEYAVHDALNRQDASVVERVDHALHKLCKVKGSDTASILFGAEKTGAVQLIDTSRQRLTDESSILVGQIGRPVKLKRYMNMLADAFRNPKTRIALPFSINGLWKADLFVGSTGSDRWVGTTVKINEEKLEPAKGLRIGIVPTRHGKSDKVRLDEARNLVVCPLPYDHAFMEVFYKGWQVVQQFFAADAGIPKESALPQPALRQVAQYLVDRRKFPVLDVVEALIPLSQPELLRTEERSADLLVTRGGDGEVGGVVAPIASKV